MRRTGVGWLVGALIALAAVAVAPGAADASTERGVSVATAPDVMPIADVAVEATALIAPSGAEFGPTFDVPMAVVNAQRSTAAPRADRERSCDAVPCDNDTLSLTATSASRETRRYARNL